MYLVGFFLGLSIEKEGGRVKRLREKERNGEEEMVSACPKLLLLEV